MEKKIGIWGWWQGNNLGDNWIKKTLSDIFPHAEFVETTVQEIDKYDFMICGGGGLFVHDVIPPWDKLSKNILKKVSFGMFGLGAEFPHKNNIAVDVASNAKFFFVRDQYSLDCMHLSKLEKSFDITFSRPLSFVSEENINIDKLFFVWRDGEELLQNDSFKEYIQAGSSYDEWKELVSVKFPEIIEDDFQTQGDNIEDRISDCGFIISGRYHGIVAAIQKGLPFIAIDICPKIRALLEECGLEKYCIKISEIDKVNDLVSQVSKELKEIRKKEKEFCDTAYKVLERQIQEAQLEILKALYPLKLIHYGSYWMKENDVINTMADDLQDCCELKKIDLKAYDRKPNSRIEKCSKTPNGMLCVLNHKKIISDVKKNKANGIILNSGGLYLHDETFCELRKRNVITIGMSLSDPDVYPYNGQVYAEKFDQFYTNSKYSFVHQYDSKKVNIDILPFAASIKHHYYMPEVEKKYDVVVVGHAREERKKIISKLSQICKIGTYGNGWDESLGVVNGTAHVEAINSGNMYLSFAQTVAGYENVKVGLFEAIACNQVVITSYMEELEDYFNIGSEILCYRDEDELLEIVKYYTLHESEREKIRTAGYRRFLKEHTYEKRWNKVLASIYVQQGRYEEVFG